VIAGERVLLLILKNVPIRVRLWGTVCRQDSQGTLVDEVKAGRHDGSGTWCDNVCDLLQLLDEQGSELRGSNSTAVRKARQFYAACMNITATEQRGSTPLLKVLDNHCIELVALVFTILCLMLLRLK